MADKVYPSAKPATTPTATATTTANGTASGTFPATKSQLYGATRTAYRLPAPSKKKAKHRRNCFCRCCLWTTVTIFVLILLVAIVGAIFYVLYRPHRPTFAVSSLKISTLKLASSSQALTTVTNLNITAINPNKKVTFIYNPMTVTLLTTSDDIVLGTGSVPSFDQGKKNTTLLKVAVGSSGQQLDNASAGKLKTDLKSKHGLNLKVVMDTKLKVKFGGLKLPRVGIRVTCDGITGTVPKGKTATSASVENSKCKGDLRIKIWKWTF